MCGKCVILTYDEVLDVIREIEVNAPFNFDPDWSARPDGASGAGSADGATGVANAAEGIHLVQTELFPEIGTPGTSQSVDRAQSAAHPQSSLRPQAFPNSVAPLIVPQFDTARTAPDLREGALDACTMAWGFEESWKPGVVFNTRIESAAKPTWRDSMEHRRCIIPVTAFFETHNSETQPSPRTGKPIKRQYEFRVPGEDIILIGCIWKNDRFSMVTTEANADMAPIHHRMPVIVRREELPLWFGPDYRELADRRSIKLEAERA